MGRLGYEGNVTFHQSTRTDEANDVGIDVGAEECHGATSMKDVSGNLVGRDTGLINEGDGGKAEHVGDMGRADVSPRTIDKNGVKWSVGGCIVHVKVLHTMGKGLDGAHIGMACGAMADRFPLNGVFLVGEDELNEGGMPGAIALLELLDGHRFLMVWAIGRGERPKDFVNGVHDNMVYHASDGDCLEREYKIVDIEGSVYMPQDAGGDCL